MSEERTQMGLPEVEFEGPMGMFWSMGDVPMEALVQGVVEIILELRKRGYHEDFILEAIKKHQEVLR